MKVFARFFSVPIGILVGGVVSLIAYLQIFDGIQLLPISDLVFKLSPGLLIGGFLGYRYPGLFFWFINFEGEVDVSDIGEISSSSEVEYKQNQNVKKK